MCVCVCVFVWYLHIHTHIPTKAGGVESRIQNRKTTYFRNALSMQTFFW